MAEKELIREEYQKKIDELTKTIAESEEQIKVYIIRDLFFIILRFTTELSSNENIRSNENSRFIRRNQIIQPNPSSILNKIKKNYNSTSTGARTVPGRVQEVSGT